MYSARSRTCIRTAQQLARVILHWQPVLESFAGVIVEPRWAQGQGDCTISYFPHRTLDKNRGQGKRRDKPDWSSECKSRTSKV